MAIPAPSPLPHLLQEDFEDFFENALCGFMTTDSQFKVIRGNSCLAGWLGYAVEDLKEVYFSDLLTIGGKIYCETHLFPLLRMQGFFEEVALELSCQNGERMPVLVNACERRDQNGQAQFIRFMVYKATDRRLYEQNLLYAKAVAEARLADEQATAVLREQFIAVLGHDLRNPLGSIAGAAMLLARSSLDPRDASLVSMISNSAARMAELIENVMDFARGRLGAGMILNRQLTLLEPVLCHVVDELRTAWPNRVIETEFE